MSSTIDYWKWSLVQLTNCGLNDMYSVQFLLKPIFVFLLAAAFLLLFGVESIQKFLDRGVFIKVSC